MKTENNLYEPKDSPQTGTVITNDDGVQMKVADMQTLTTALKKVYPDGIVIRMPDESLAHLLDIEEALETGSEYLLDEVTFAGRIDEENMHIVPIGGLKAELKLPTEMYERVTPDEIEYPLDAPEAEWMDWEDRACTRLLHEHGDNLRGAYVEVTIREEVMPFLHIEGQPYPKVMDTIERTGVVTESDLKQLLNLQNLYENGIPVDNFIPECLKDLMADVTEKYSVLQDTPVNRTRMNTDLMNQVELLLKKGGAIPTVWHNLVGTFDNRDNNAAARQIVEEMNRRFAPDIAFATRIGNQVEVSIRSTSPSDQVDVKSMFNTSPDLTRLEEKPYRNMDIAQSAYLFLRNGQILSGHIGVEGLKDVHQYGIVSKETTTGVVHQITPDVNTGHPDRIFATNEQVKRFMRDFKGEFMPVDYLVPIKDLEKQAMISQVDLKWVRNEEGKVENIILTGKVEGFPKRELELDEEDRRLLARGGQELTAWTDKRSAVQNIMCNKYFKDELDIAWQKEQQFMQTLDLKNRQTRQLFDRITDACLYGKVEDIHVRCKIDGVQQMGRPITPEDAILYAGWKEDARLLGKDTLHYKAWLHEDYIKLIAANTFSDVLNQATGQEQQQRMKR